MRALFKDEDGKSIYLPQTFESMMELFGINLKKKQLVAKFKEKKRMLEKMIKGNDYTNEEIIECQNQGHAIMVEIIGHMARTESNIVNEHNQLFMNILTRIKQENRRSRVMEKLKEQSRRGSKASSLSHNLVVAK